MGPIHLNMGAAKQVTNEKIIKGDYRPVGVLTWCSPSGQQCPKLIKYEDEEGCVQTISELNVIKHEENHYAGIRAVRYDCVCILHGIQYPFILLYQPEFHCWKMII